MVWRRWVGGREAVAALAVRGGGWRRYQRGGVGGRGGGSWLERRWWAERVLCQACAVGSRCAYRHQVNLSKPMPWSGSSYRSVRTVDFIMALRRSSGLIWQQPQQPPRCRLLTPRGNLSPPNLNRLGEGVSRPRQLVTTTTVNFAGRLADLFPRVTDVPWRTHLTSKPSQLGSKVRPG